LPIANRDTAGSTNLRSAGSLKLRHSTIEAMLNGHKPARFCAQTLEKIAFSG
jgi:hypothetical protein